MYFSGLKICRLFAFAIMFGSGRAALGGTQFYSDRATWEAALATQRLSVTNFPFTPANLVKSDEIVVWPGQNVSLGSILTFPSSSTGLPISFRVRTVELNTTFSSWDNYGLGNLAIDSTEVPPLDGNDAWELELTEIPIMAFGFDLIDNDTNLNDGEVLNVYGCGNVLLGSVSLPGSPGGIPDPKFLGVITDVPILRVLASESPTDADNIGIKNFAFAATTIDCNGNNIPTLSEWGVIAMGLLTAAGGTVVLMRRRTANT